MKIVIAPNAFKESLSAWQATQAIADGLRKALPRARIVLAPMADGGDGTAETMAAATGGRLIATRPIDPLGRPIRATYALLGDERGAVIEMASASGLRLLRANERNPMVTSTAGTGQLIQSAIRRLYRASGSPASRKPIRIVVGIGGSATVDGGAGMAAALGYRFLDSRGNVIFPSGGNLEKIARIDSEHYSKWLSNLPRKVEIAVACDVTNPLIGPQGAARVFAKQKGASPKQIEQLEAGLTHLAGIVERDLKIRIVDFPGGGSAGGLGAGLVAFLGARLQPGAEVVADAIGLEKMLQDADWLITGEGLLDDQTGFGKAPAIAARLARKHGARVVAIAGCLDKSAFDLRGSCFDAIFSICDGPMNTEKAMRDAPRLLTQFAESLGSVISMR